MTSVNDEKYQEAYTLLREQFLLRPENVVANLNAMLAETDYELKLLKADPCKMHYQARERQEQFPLFTGEKGVEF